MGKILWFTGLSGSGKTTIANLLKTKLEQQGKRVEILDGDAVRSTLHKNLGFSRDDIRENNRLIAELARKKLAAVDYVLVPIISPFREDRAMARSMIGKNFVEVFINCPLQKCVEKDVKGHYQKALQGKITDFIGIHTPYEPPQKPDLEIRTDTEEVTSSVQKILSYLQNI